MRSAVASSPHRFCARRPNRARGFTSNERVRIQYTRPPGRVTFFEQWRVHASDDVIVTFVEHSQVERSIIVEGEVILEPGSPAVWFTFPGLSHDIGRFYKTDGSFTGLYANVLTPVRFLDELAWETTDLFLDVWFGATANGPTVLDEEELLEALSHGWISAEQAEEARSETARIIGAYATGAWPPAVVREWPLERAQAVVSR